jgi:hypothetical protein
VRRASSSVIRVSGASPCSIAGGTVVSSPMGPPIVGQDIAVEAAAQHAEEEWEKEGLGLWGEGGRGKGQRDVTA